MSSSTPNAITIAHSIPSVRLGKEFARNVRGEWREKGKLKPAFTYTFEQRVVETLEQYADLRRALLTAESSCILQGAPRQLDGIHRRSGGESEKSTDTLIDYPKHWLTLDMDQFDASRIAIDWAPHEHALPRDLAQMLEELFGEVAPELTSASCVCVLSSSTGIMPGVLKAHITFRLKAPLTLRQQRAYVHSLSRRVAVDKSIYKPASILYTARSLTITEDSGGGYRLSEPPYTGARVFVLESDSDELTINIAALEVEAAVAVKVSAHEVRESSFAKSQLEDIAPGATHGVLLSLAWRASKRVAKVDSQAWAEAISSLAREKFYELYGSVMGELKWQEHATVPALLRMYNSAALKTGATLSSLPSLPASKPTPEPVKLSVRDRLQADFAADVKAAEKGKHAMSLYRASAGAGKTAAAHMALTPSSLSSMWTIMASPTKALSAESAGRLRAYLRSKWGMREELIDTYVRVQRGIADVCTEASRKAALAVLGSSIQPLKALCLNCPLRETCEYPRMRSMMGTTGIDFIQHAHITTLMHRYSENAPALSIIDESFLGVLLGAEKKRSFGSLRPVASLAGIYEDRPSGTLGQLLRPRTSQGLSADRMSIRDTLHRLLSQLDGKVYLKAISEITGFKALPDGRDLPWYVWALEVEYQYTKVLQALLDKLVSVIIDEGHTGMLSDPDSLVVALTTELVNNAFVIDILRAIRASAKAEEEGRRHVFGLTVSQLDQAVNLHIANRMPQYFDTNSVIMLDGTSEPSFYERLARRHGRQLVTREHIMTHGSYHLTQWHGATFGKSAMLGDDGTFEQVRRHILAIALTERRKATARCIINGRRVDVLVVAQVEVEKKLLSSGLPSNVCVGHFNAMRGLDVFKTVPAVVVVGRPMPDPIALHKMAEAMLYDDSSVLAITVSDSMAAVIELQRADGTMHSAAGERHPDARVQELVEMTANGELRQALARARLFDRSEANTAKLYVFGAVNTGIPVHAFADMAETDPGADGVIAAAGVIDMADAEQQAELGRVGVTYRDLAITGYRHDWRRVGTTLWHQEVPALELASKGIFVVPS